MSFFTDEQKDAVKRLFCKGFDEDQTLQFLMVCERAQLDPFTRQIYARLQNQKQTRGGQVTWTKTLVIITGIDGLRAIAERSGEYRGQTAPEWYFDNGDGEGPKWHDRFLGCGRGIKVPEAARVGIFRKDFNGPVIGVATYDSFVQFGKEDDRPMPTSFWRKMPDVQLLKCAEAQGLRKAFPLLLGGIYIEEELKDDQEEGAPVEQTTQATSIENDPNVQWVNGPKAEKAKKQEKSVPPEKRPETANAPTSRQQAPEPSKAPAAQEKPKKHEAEYIHPPIGSEQSYPEEKVYFAAYDPHTENGMWRIYGKDRQEITEWPEGWPTTLDGTFLKSHGIEVITVPAKATPAPAAATPAAPATQEAEVIPPSSHETKNDSGDPLGYVCTLTPKEFNGKKLGDIPLERLLYIKQNWLERSKEKIQNNPTLTLEAEMILAAIAKLSGK